MGRGVGWCSFVASLSNLTTLTVASLSKRITVPTANEDTSSVWVLGTFVPCITSSLAIAWLEGDTWAFGLACNDSILKWAQHIPYGYFISHHARVQSMNL